jgi:hypothetical protein
MTRLPRIGFRVVGTTWTRRIVVDHAAAFRGYVCCDPRASIDKEGYLSAFRFTNAFRDYFGANGNSERDFQGVCWSDWLWFDVDRDDLRLALDDTRRLARAVLERFSSLDGDDLLAFYSGRKGFHLGIPTCVWRPAPDERFHLFARRFCGRISEAAGVRIDTGVYSLTRLFRAPNTRHPKTGLHKRHLGIEGLLRLNLEGIQRLAELPESFELPIPRATSEQAAQDWQEAITLVGRQAEANQERRTALDGKAVLNRHTTAFLRGEVDPDRRAVHLFSSAANLAELDCPPSLAFALLEEPALDAGLEPKEVKRQIETGLRHGAKQREGNGND